MKFKKAAIVMTIVPAMFFAGCSSKNDEYAQQQQQIADVANTLNDSYAQAKANGYTGTYEEWVKLVELQQTDPAAAQAQAKASGFNGFDMLMAGAMGMMLGNMLSKPSYGGYKSSSYYDEDRRRPSGSSYVAPAKRSYSSGSRATTSTSGSAKATSSGFSKSSASTSLSRGGFGGAVSSGG